MTDIEEKRALQEEQESDIACSARLSRLEKTVADMLDDFPNCRRAIASMLRHG